MASRDVNRRTYFGKINRRPRPMIETKNSTPRHFCSPAKTELLFTRDNWADSKQSIESSEARFRAKRKKARNQLKSDAPEISVVL
jgi:hypothetical protein